MTHHPHHPASPTWRAVRRVLAALVLTVGPISAAPSAVAVRAQATPPPTDPAPAPGTDLWRLDTARAHYTQGDNGQIHLQLYSGPVGLASPSGWHARDTRLQAPDSTGKVAPAELPDRVRIATGSDAAMLASLTSEDGVTLGIGLASINGERPAAVTGQVNDDTITFHSPVSTTPSDVSLQATTAGVNLRMVLHKPAEGTPISFALTPDPRTQLAQAPDGRIAITRAITGYGMEGTSPFVKHQTEYFVETPVARDSNPDPAAAVQTAPVTMSLGATSSGQPELTLSVDPAWLLNPARVFPVRVDVPVVTSYAHVNSGQLATINSCASTTPAPRTDMVVGAAGSCAYHGQVYFDVSPLQPDTTVQSATLYLYTPAQTGSTGVQVYPNAPRPEGAQWQQPTWESAPTVVTGAVGVAQSASNGHWQSWDVTDLVRGWVQQPGTNGGLTLTGTGAPLLFASPLGAGSGKPDVAPYLDITYTRQPAVSSLSTMSTMSPLSVDGTDFIYGLGGTYVADGSCGAIACSGHISMHGVQNNQTAGIGGRYVRIDADLKCTASPSTPPPAGYWGTQSASPNNGSPIDQLLSAAYTDRVIPIILFVPDSTGQCTSLMGNPTTWSTQIQDFIDWMPYPTSATIYFEVGNEPNERPDLYGGSGSAAAGSNFTAYANIFAAAARSIQARTAYWGYNSYRTLVAGILQPTSSTDGSTCDPNIVNTMPYATINYQEPQQALKAAETGSPAVPAARLAVSVHPYIYNTADYTYWRTFRDYYGHPYAGACYDLGGMFNLWTTQQYLSGVPIFVTEINWTDHTNLNDSNAEGAYLVDLFTWFYDHGYASASSSNVRVLPFAALDGPPLYIGLYGANSGNAVEKYTTIPSGTYTNALHLIVPYCSNTPVVGTHTLSNNYYWLRNGACY